MYLPLLQAQVERRRPFLHEVLQAHGQEPVGQYAAGFWQQARNAGDAVLAARASLGDIVAEAAAEVYDRALVDTLRQSWPTIPILTADHHGPTFYPGLLSGDLLFGLDGVLSASPAPVVVLACANVPLSNSTGPRGIFLPPWLDPPATTYSFFPPSMLDHSVSVAGAYSGERLARLLDRLRGKLHQQRLPRKAVTETLDTLAACFGQATTQPTYARQISVANHLLWPYFFEPSLRPGLPPLLYLQLEDICSRVLSRRPGLLESLLYDSSFRADALEMFAGIPGCWDGAGSGTHFFWGVDDRGCTYSLTLLPARGKAVPHLRGRSGEFELRPEVIDEALRQHRLVPGLMLCFAALVFCHGCRVYGGFMQVDYLTRMKQAWLGLLARQHSAAAADFVAQIETRNYATGPLLAYTRYAGDFYPSGGLDILLSGGLQRAYLEQVCNLSVMQLNQAGLVEMLHIILDHADWPAELATLTAGQILKELGLEERLRIATW